MTALPKGFPVLTTDRGFEYLDGCDVRQSSAIGDYDDAFERPGSSALWIDGDHVDREGVREMLNSFQQPPGSEANLRAWLKTGSLQPQEGGQ